MVRTKKNKQHRNKTLKGLRYKIKNIPKNFSNDTRKYHHLNLKIS